jgi:hypothetical protein
MTESFSPSSDLKEKRGHPLLAQVNECPKLWLSTVEYRVALFIQSLQLLSQTEPCSLCGEVHPLEIHSCVARSYRDPQTLADVWIEVPVHYNFPLEQGFLKSLKRCRDMAVKVKTPCTFGG